MIEGDDAKAAVAEFWERASCGEVYADGQGVREFYDSQARARYQLEPYIFSFADFPSANDKDVLEIGVGMGADHLEWARCRPRSLAGVDLTARAIAFTRERLRINGLPSDLRVADAESLPFSDNTFDIVYSWGVLHHSPNTRRAIEEVRRVLRPGGQARIMVYHTHAIVGYLLWLRYALLRGRPFMSLSDIYSRYLESPGTKAYTPAEAKAMFSDFTNFKHEIRLSVGDLMEGAAGQRHGGLLLRVARGLWPRRLVRSLLPSHGLFLLIRATK